MWGGIRKLNHEIQAWLGGVLVVFVVGRGHGALSSDRQDLSVGWSF